jgi:phosphate transport system substrate-binding protein
LEVLIGLPLAHDERMKQLASVILTAAMFCGAAPSSRAETIVMTGSDTMLILAQKWAEVYMTNHPGMKIDVSGGGSGIGIAALQHKTTDLCDASRQLTAEEIAACISVFDKRPTEYKVALDGLSIYVHPENPVSEITLEQLAKVFTGKIRNWKELKGRDAAITVYGRETVSGTYEFFKEHVLHGEQFTMTAQTMPGTVALLRAVAKDMNGIGYGGTAYGRGSKALRIRKTATSPAIEANEANVVKGVYPIWRYLYIYVNPDLDQDAVGNYLNWIRGDEGQNIVKDVGYFALPKYLRENRE